MLSASQIAVFFDHQYLCKESLNLLDFLHGDNDDGDKVASDTITFFCMWPVVPAVQSDYRIL